MLVVVIRVPQFPQCYARPVLACRRQWQVRTWHQNGSAPQRFSHGWYVSWHREKEDLHARHLSHWPKHQISSRLRLAVRYSYNPMHEHWGRQTTQWKIYRSHMGRFGFPPPEALFGSWLRLGERVDYLERLFGESAEKHAQDNGPTNLSGNFPQCVPLDTKHKTLNGLRSIHFFSSLNRKSKSHLSWTLVEAELSHKAAQS